MTSGATGWVVAFTPRKLTSGRQSARIALSRTGNTSGAHPASTALIATARRGTMRRVGGARAGEHRVDPLECRSDYRNAASPPVPGELGLHGLGRIVSDLDEP